MRNLSVLLILSLCWLVLISPAHAEALPASHVDNFAGHPRLIVISDIGNEPDDQMSLTRLLLYSNEIAIEALIAGTSTWQKTVLHPETMRTLIAAYGEVRNNLLRHASGWPVADDLNRIVYSGQSGYGMAATGPGRLSEGATAIIKAADRADDRPLWISLWGGANTLAQALLTVRQTRTPAELERFISRLRISSISDQDDAGPWIRREFPSLFYIVQPSTPTSGEYYSATWTGISGDRYYRNCAGADSSLVTNEWLDQHVRKGPLGKLYPRFLFIMEGDTPSFLGLIDNGLNAYRRPDWGGWGGRYIYRQPYGETHSIWTQGGDEFARVTSQDEVIGVDGREYVSDQATIWRWREAFQNDFAARIAWTTSEPAAANHNPVVSINGQSGTSPLTVEVTVHQPITLDATATSDPDRGQSLHYRWFLYGEAGWADGSLAAVDIAGADTAKAVVTPTATCRPMWLKLGPGAGACPAAGTAHLILAVTDSGEPALTSYRRVILKVRQ